MCPSVTDYFVELPLLTVWQKKRNVIQLHLIDEVLDGGTARPRQLFLADNMYNNRPVGSIGGESPDSPLPPDRILERLERLHTLVYRDGLAAVIAMKLKTIADALAASEQRFFHHDRNYPKGLWFDRHDSRVKYISDSSTLVCDEAQRLGTYGDLDEAEWVRNRPGSTFLCGDDYQRLNLRGDRGIIPVIEGGGFSVHHLPESVGIPPEIGTLVKAMLGEAETPTAPSSFSIKLLFNDDLGLVDEFSRDPHGKKHYAIPMSSGFYRGGYYPHITRSQRLTDKCTDECTKNPYGICRHRHILPLSPLNDPDWMPKREDLGRRYKFFCAEAIMPEYALSAYELISREVESVYLKIPWQIRLSTLRAPMSGEKKDSWIKRHLYVLMTRATARLVINVEDRRLYEFFKWTCQTAGLEP